MFLADLVKLHLKKLQTKPIPIISVMQMVDSIYIILLKPHCRLVIRLLQMRAI